MPVYEPKDYEKVIERIQGKIDVLQIEMGECLSEGEITAFEDCHKVRLPQAYRLFLKKVGNGCEHMFENRRLNSLEGSLCQKYIGEISN